MSGVKNYLKIVATMFASMLVITLSAQSLEEARKLYNEGGEAVQNGNLELGIEKFNECIDMCQILVDDYEDMEAEELMYTVQQNVPKLYYQLAMDQIKSGQITEGVDNLYEAKETADYYGDDDIAEKTKNVIPKVHYKLAVSKYKNSDYDGAIVELDKAIEVDETYASAHYLKAAIYKAQGEDEKFAEAARGAMEAATASNDNDIKKKTSDLAATYFLKIGNDAKEASEYDKAVKNLKYSIEFDEDNATAHYLLTSVYIAQNKWDEAIAAANAGIAHESGTGQARFYYEMGKAYYGKGDNAAACDAYSKAAVGDYAEHATYEMEHVVKCNE